jgi:type II secretory pathway pseudopilin PulG
MKPTRINHCEFQPRARRAFLFVELVIGLVIIAMVLMGAAAIIEAVADGWNDQDVTRSTQVQANQTSLRIQNALEGAQFIGYPGSSGTASTIFFWANTNIGGAGETDPCAGEMELIQYDSTDSTNSIWLYYCPNPKAAGAGAVLTFAEINQPATWFTQQSFVEKRCLGGPGGTNDGTQLNVTDFTAYVSALSSTSQLPVVEYSIDFTRSDGTSLTLYSSTTVKGPTTQPE